LVAGKAPSAPAAVEALGVTKVFNGRPANLDVYFHAFAGEIHTVLGENGAGKSTLTSMLAGVYRPDSGEVRVRGRKIAFHSPRDALRAGVGVVYQEFHLVENLTVLENALLGTGMRPWGRKRDAVGDQARQAGFDLPLSAPVRLLNIGHRQQVEILKLLLRDPDVLIFDEPTAVLGEAQVGELFATLDRLRRRGKAIVLITHRLREVRMVADRLTVLREGRTTAAGRRPAEFTDAALTELMVGPGTGAPARTREPAAMGEIVLRLVGVHLSSRSGSGLRGVDLAVAAGELVGVAGVRGNGQREIAEVAAGLAPPGRGRVEHAGGDVSFIPEDRLGMGLCRRMTIGQNLALRCYRKPPIGRPWQIDRAALQSLAERQIARYGIPARADRIVTQLSGGGLQRVVVARELDQRARLIVAAQPTRGLDIRSAEFVRRRLVEAAERGVGVLVISEDLDELMAMTDRIVVLYEGCVAADVPRSDFDRQYLGTLMLGARNDRHAS